MRLTLILIPTLACMIGNAGAEQGCPPGQYPIGGQGATACAPIPQENQVQQQAVPNGEWVKTCGAIAAGAIDSTTSYGVTTGKASKSEAEQDSLRRCASHGEDNCKVAFTYRNQCVAIAEPQINGLPLTSGAIRFAGAATVSQASSEAYKDCRKFNEITPVATCKIVYTACTEPIFHRY